MQRQSVAKQRGRPQVLEWLWWLCRATLAGTTLGITLGFWCLLPLHGAHRGAGLGSRFSWCAAVCGSLFGRTNPLCSLFLTLCLPVAPLRSLSLCPGLGSLTKPFTSSRTPISLATCMCSLQTISCPTGSGGPAPALPASQGKGGCWEGLGSGEVPEGG